jgi:molybdopterin-guanine dinucleotide biosynthesis protein A
MTAYDAVVLAGGSARRLGGVDKPALVVGGRMLLAAAVDAVAGARRTVVVGPPRPVAADVIWSREDPPGGGPAAALAAGLALVEESVVVVLAADLPFVTGTDVAALLAAVQDDGAVTVDAAGEPQWLLSAWRVAALRRALAPAGSLRRSLATLRFARVALPVGAERGAPSWFDVDTPADLDAVKEKA